MFYRRNLPIAQREKSKIKARARDRRRYAIEQAACLEMREAEESLEWRQWELEKWNFLPRTQVLGKAENVAAKDKPRRSRRNRSPEDPEKHAARTHRLYVKRKAAYGAFVEVKELLERLSYDDSK